MSRSYWLPIIAFGGVLALFVAGWVAVPHFVQFHKIACKAPDANSDAAETSQHPQYSNSSPHVLERIARALESANASGESNDKAKRELADLTAQQDMACWGGWMLLATTAQAVIGSLGLVALLTTIRQGHQTLAEAKRSNERQLRAYLGVSYSGHGQLTNLSYTFGVKIKNFGQTPAYDVSFTLPALAIIEKKIPCSFLFSDTAPKPLVLQPDREIDGGSVTLSFPNAQKRDDFFQEMENATAYAHIFGKINYKDAFDIPRWTKYRFKTNGHMFRNGAAVVTHSDNEAT